MSSETEDRMFQQALACQRAGDLRQAESLYRRILADRPDHADALNMLGMLGHQVGKTADAMELVRRAIALRPDAAAYHSNLGMLLAARGETDRAIDSFRRAAELRPDSPEALSNLGNALMARGDFDAAIAAHRRAVELRPDAAHLVANLGSALGAAGRIDEAIAEFHRALKLEPGRAGTWFNLGRALHQRGDRSAALDAVRRATELEPGSAEAQNNLGVVLQSLGRNEPAAAAFRRAVELNPNYAEAWNNLGVMLHELREHDSAVAAYHRALAIRPNFPDAMGNLASSLSQIGDAAGAREWYERALALQPHPRTAGGLLLFLHLQPESDSKTIFQAASHWNRVYAAPIARSAEPYRNDPDPDRPLRIGYVSPDFSTHAVGRFMLPLLESHDHGKFRIACWSDAPVEDETTRKLRSFADEWIDATGLSDRALEERIRADGIDILVDLAMHTRGNRLLLFARKPAPVQVTYLAYPSTTGLEAIDYRLSDPWLDPPDRDETVYSEKTIRLRHCYWCYQPLPNLPPVGPPPIESAGVVTFGCLNNFWKVSRPALDTWMRLMERVPGSRLILQSPEGVHRERLLREFESRGIARSRIEFVGFEPIERHFARYQRIDIGLDPFPCGGGTTTCDALWMGVPVVSLAGETAVSRAGLSILSNIGLEELVARDVTEYLRIAADLAVDPPRLAALRTGLRTRMLQSPLMNAPAFTRDVEAIYRKIWRTWCTDQTARELQ